MLRYASSLVIAAYAEVRLIPQDSRALPAAFLRSRPIFKTFYGVTNSDRTVRIIVDTDPLFCYKKAAARIAGAARRQKNGRRNRFPGNKRTGGRLARKKETDSRARALLCINASLEKKAKELIILNVSGISSFADYFILCSGTSDRQVRAIAAAIQENVKKAGILPLGVEGESGGKWILLDYDDVIIHVFLESVRTFYDLERLWSETPRMAVPDETVSLKALAEGI